MTYSFTRRRLLRSAVMAPLAAFLAACGRSAGANPEVVATPEGVSIAPASAQSEAVAATPVPAPTPEPPFIVAAGDTRRLMMPGTAYETPVYIFGTGKPGKVVLVLGGVHGNEPGGWLGAERVVERVRPESGALLVAPRANKVAVNLFSRTTTDLGDLNRSYPGFGDGLPMERMAAEISNLIGEFHVHLVHDMHESWSFYRDRTSNGTAFLGQTVATNGPDGIELASAVVKDVNGGIQAQHEEFFLRNFGGQNPSGQPQPDPAGVGAASLPRQQDTPPPGRGTSSLGLNRYFPGVMTLLVEMGQQQSLERRTALHVAMLEAAMRQMGILG